MLTALNKNTCDKAYRASHVPTLRTTAATIAANGLGSTVENNRQNHDTNPTNGSQTHIESADTAQYHLA